MLSFYTDSFLKKKKVIFFKLNIKIQRCLLATPWEEFINGTRICDWLLREKAEYLVVKVLPRYLTQLYPITWHVSIAIGVIRVTSQFEWKQHLTMAFCKKKSVNIWYNQYLLFPEERDLVDNHQYLPCLCLLPLKRNCMSMMGRRHRTTGCNFRLSCSSYYQYWECKNHIKACMSYFTHHRTHDHYVKGPGFWF